MEEIYGAIVTYNPDIQNLEKNIKSIINQVNKLFVFDNNSKNKSEIKKLQQQYNFEVIYGEINEGLSKAYNNIIFPHINECNFFVTFDQDSFIPENAIDILLKIIKKDASIGAVGPVFARERGFSKLDGNTQFVEVIIQSCAVFRSEAIAKTGGFNEDYFIDSVDFEYCLRLLQKGYKVARYDGVCIQHELGEEKKILGIKYYSHNRLRNYYIARNHMDITRRFYKSFPAFVLKKNIFFILHFFKLLIFERDAEKIKYFLNGIKNKSL